jgi:hypothetical protein
MASLGELSGMEHTDESRELGVEFGGLTDDLTGEEYPVKGTDLIEVYGDRQIDLADGSETVREILGPVSEQSYDSPEDVRQAVIGMVGDGAIGRKRYDDRSGLSDDRRSTDESI